MNLHLHIIPQPKQISGHISKDGTARAKRMSLRVNATSPEFDRVVTTFCDITKKITGIAPSRSDAPEAVTFVQKHGIKPGAYRILSDDFGLKAYASDAAGAFAAAATMVQMIEKIEGELYVPLLEIADQADAAYRSVMIDLARDWHGFAHLMRYVDLCFFYKVSVLHFHFTDDQSYTLPSRLYPKLSTPGRSYTEEQIRTLAEYAHLRGVELVPEIDVPGHCIAHQENYPDVFGTGGILIQTQQSVDATKALFGELCDFFPYSHYIHIGGDEAAIDKWVGVEESADYYRSVGIDPAMPDRRLLAERIYANFINEMANAVFAKGRQPIAWEGFSPLVNDYVRKDLLIYSWENFYQTTYQLLEGGFKILNGSWIPMYIVTPKAYWSVEEIYNRDAFSWNPLHGGSPYYGKPFRIEPNENVLGGALLAWGDHIAVEFADDIERGVCLERSLVMERMPAMCESFWNLEKLRPYSAFAETYELLKSKAEQLIV